jgi:hypothetical protein
MKFSMICLAARDSGVFLSSMIRRRRTIVGAGFGFPAGALPAPSWRGPRSARKTA